jgi:hypothetical protein
MRTIVLLTLITGVPPAFGGTLCFSPVQEKEGDVASDHRSWWQPFDYRVQVDDGPVVVPSAEESTPYSYTNDEPLVKIWLGGKVVESFRIDKDWLAEGRNCIYFKNLYETWTVAEKWQAERLCSCTY